MARLGSESVGGFYPMPLDELSFLCRKLRFSSITEEPALPSVRIIDPCCGKGEALRVIANCLQEQGATVQTYGVELEDTRAIEAKETLDFVIHDGYENLRTQAAFSLLWLNPPYQEGFTERTEISFLRQLSSNKHGVLVKDGILMFIIPQFVLKEAAALLSGRFQQFRVYRFTDSNYERFRQIVVIAKFGKTNGAESKKNYKWLRQLGEDEKNKIPTLAEIEEIINIPYSTSSIDFFRAGRLNTEELALDLGSSPIFEEVSKRIGFRNVYADMKRPMLPLKPTHMGVAIAAGAIGGNMGNHIVSGITKRRTDITSIYDEDGKETGQKMTEYFQSIVRVFNEEGVFDLE
ncbi:DUF6094 domain-containing protein [Paenibacillus tepidiphilus]|uniref:DUF6094 domain-containing protein n=1 Tax=Paenibacillus tepidiphilus TaxID=2608683 RepID=UPI00123BC235|nr:DUF6094 domain-containing protein [Paenibacillus tepidiphilus]